MKEKLQKFLNILKIELLDLEEDISILEELYRQREKNREITSYVLMENIIVIQQELRGIHSLVDSMAGISPEVYSDLDDLVADLDNRFKEQLADRQIPAAMMDLLKRKLEKVKEYVSKA